VEVAFVIVSDSKDPVGSACYSWHALPDLIVLADSAYYCGAARRGGGRFSVTVTMDPKVRAAIAAIPEIDWTPVRYPRATWDDQLPPRIGTRAACATAGVAQASWYRRHRVTPASPAAPCTGPAS